MFCTKCGKELKEGVQFCTGCGAQLKMVPAYKAEEAEAPAEVVAAQAESAKPEPQPAALQGTGKKKKTGLWLFLALILVVGIGCTVYFLFLREKPGKENPSDANLSQETSGPDALAPGGQDMRPKVWAQTEDAEIAQLIDRYFQAKTEANAAELERILIPGSAVDSVSLSQDAQVYEWYRDIRVYSYPGMKSMETGLFVTYYSKFKNIDTPLPTIAWFYAKPDKENNLKLMPLTDDASSEYKYIYSTYAGSLVEKLAGEVSAANKKAIENDPNLKQYLAQLATKNYEPFVPETTTALSTTAPPSSATAQAAQPTTPAQTTRATETVPSTTHASTTAMPTTQVPATLESTTHAATSSAETAPSQPDSTMQAASQSEGIATADTWLRESPGLAGKEIVTIKKGNRFVSTGKKQEGVGADGVKRWWYEVVYDGKRGWVSEKNVEWKELQESTATAHTHRYSPHEARVQEEWDEKAGRIDSYYKISYYCPECGSGYSDDTFLGSRRITSADYVNFGSYIFDYTTGVTRALYGLEHNTFLGGVHTLSGQIVEIVTPYDSVSKTITVNLLVTDWDHLVTAYRLVGGADLSEGDWISVTGRLTRYNEWYEFAEGATYSK